MWNTSFFWIHVLCSYWLEICTAYRDFRHLVQRSRTSFLCSARPKLTETMESVAPSGELKVAEFFSGIGGWSSAFSLQSNLEFLVVAAYDVNIVSNLVYKHVYGHTPSSTSIESLSVKTLEALGADIWVMSPPCQPYTRQHPATENDPRSNALLHLIKSIKKLKNPPRYLALENVIGFEESPACTILLDTLDGMGYNFKQFALSPTQFGVPNERPRYYLLAVLHGKFPTVGPETAFSTAEGQSIDGSSDQPEEAEISLGIIDDEAPTAMKTTPAVAVKGMDALNEIVPTIITSISNVRTVDTSIPGFLATPPRSLESYLAESLPLTEIESLLVPAKSLAKNASWCLDIVAPDDTHTSCFTKSYSKYFKGTGSVLLIPDPYPVIDQQEATLSLASTSSSSSSSSTISAMQESENEVPVPDTSTDVVAEDGLGLGLGSQADPLMLLVRSDVAVKGATSSDFREAPETRTFDLNWKDKLKGNKLRFFSPDELLRIFGFLPLPDKIQRINLKKSSSDFESIPDIIEEGSIKNAARLSKSSFFPENVTTVNCYQMIGNSLSVTVVSHLLDFMLRSTITKSLK